MCNVPDDCKGNNPNLPWNEEFNIKCFHCDELITEDEEPEEVMTKRSGVQHVHKEDCLDKFYEGDF